MQPREFWIQKKFSDMTKYPYGFSRSGEFTLAQSAILENTGQLITALINGKVSNPTKKDLELKDAILNNNLEYSETARLWLKYKNTHHQKISVSSSRSTADEDDWVSDEPLTNQI